MKTQIIEKNGKPEWAVIPYKEYLNLVEHSEMLQDIRVYDSVKQAVANGERLIPGEVTFAILSGQNPIKMWREHRNITLSQLAEALGIGIKELNEIEAGKRAADFKELESIAEALDFDVDDISD